MAGMEGAVRQAGSLWEAILIQATDYSGDDGIFPFSTFSPPALLSPLSLPPFSYVYSSLLLCLWLCPCTPPFYLPVASVLLLYYCMLCLFPTHCIRYSCLPAPGQAVPLNACMKIG